MSKPSFQDITPPRRSIRDVPVPEKKQTVEQLRKESHQHIHSHDEKHEEIINPPEEENIAQEHDSADYSDESRSPKWLIWSVAVVALVAIFFVTSMFFAGAQVTVTPKVENTSVSLIATSTKDGSNGTLAYDVIILNREESSADLLATTTAPTSTASVAQPVAVPVAPKPASKASGTITISNSYSSAPQDLIATTRFETADGLIYRINKDVSVPGMTSVNGKNVPGTISVTVYADQTGAKYNIGPTTFTIPGFQGTAKYSAFSAQSKSSMVGGSSGTVGSGTASAVSNSASDDPSSDTQIALKSQIQNDLIKEANAQMPDNYILYPAASLFSFSKASSTSDYMSGTSSSSEVREQGTAYFVIFDKDALSRFLQSQLIASTSANSDSAYIENINGLSISAASNSIQDIIANSPLLLTITGTIPVSWNINSSQLANDLEGKSKQSLQAVLRKYPEVGAAEAAITPFWKSSFPADSGNIKIILKSSTTTQ